MASTDGASTPVNLSFMVGIQGKILNLDEKVLKYTKKRIKLKKRTHTAPGFIELTRIPSSKTPDRSYEERRARVKSLRHYKRRRKTKAWAHVRFGEHGIACLGRRGQMGLAIDGSKESPNDGKNAIRYIV